MRGRQFLPRPVFWILAPILAAFAVGMPLMPSPNIWLTLGLSLAAIFLILGFYDSIQFKWALQLVGIAVAGCAGVSAILAMRSGWLKPLDGLLSLAMLGLLMASSAILGRKNA